MSRQTCQAQQHHQVPNRGDTYFSYSGSNTTYYHSQTHCNLGHVAAASEAAFAGKPSVAPSADSLNLAAAAGKHALRLLFAVLAQGLLAFVVAVAVAVLVVAVAVAVVVVVVLAVAAVSAYITTLVVVWPALPFRAPDRYCSLLDRAGNTHSLPVLR